MWTASRHRKNKSVRSRWQRLIHSLISYAQTLNEKDLKSPLKQSDCNALEVAFVDITSIKYAFRTVGGGLRKEEHHLCWRLRRGSPPRPCASALRAEPFLTFLPKPYEHPGSCKCLSCMHRNNFLAYTDNGKQVKAAHNEKQLNAAHNEKQLNAAHNEKQLNAAHNEKQLNTAHIWNGIEWNIDVNLNL
jgi:hypothetical protein